MASGDNLTVAHVTLVAATGKGTLNAWRIFNRQPGAKVSPKLALLEHIFRTSDLEAVYLDHVVEFLSLYATNVDATRLDQLGPIIREAGVSYQRFAAMIVGSTVVMFGLMYLNTYALSHIAYSQTRMWMAFVMGAAMAFVMLGFMWSMYRNRRVNFAILLSAAAIFAIALWLVRSQETVDDTSYMKAMIPHHSIAILTSERAHLKDPEVRRLADGIIDAQVREIEQMKRMITRLEARPTPDGAPDLPSYREKGVPPPPPQTDESTGIDTLKPIR